MGIAASLQAVFSAAFAALYGDGVLHKSTLTDDGQGEFSAMTTDFPVKVLVDGLSEADRAAGGLPREAVRLTILRAGLAAPIAIDDSVSADGLTYRIIQTGTDPAGAAASLVAVPA